MLRFISGNLLEAVRHGFGVRSGDDRRVGFIPNIATVLLCQSLVKGHYDFSLSMLFLLILESRF